MASLFSAVSEWLWPSRVGTPPVIAASSGETAPTDKWSVFLTHEGKTARIDELIQYVKSDFDFPISSIPFTKKFEALEVGMNQGVVLEVTANWKPITQLGSNVVVQMRGRTKEGTLSHIGLVQLSGAQNINLFKEKLEEILNACDGTIEIFIGGGRASTQKLYESIRQHIDSANKKHKRLTRTDDCYGITNLAEVYFEHRNKAYIGSARIEEAGFDENNAPYMVLTAGFPRGTPPIEDGEVYSMMDQDYRIKV